MFKKLVKNLNIKIFCLVVSSLLWVYAASGQSAIGKFPGSIKIKTINVPSGLVAIYDEKTVNIKITADSAVWKNLASESFSAFVDLSNCKEGTYELPVNVVSSVSGLQIVEKTPEKIFVRVESIVEKELPINQKIEGSAAEGLTVGSVDLDSEKIKVKGPKSVIDNLSEATIVLKMNGESVDFDRTLTVAAYDENGEAIPNLEFNPSEVKAKVSVVKASNNKTVGIKVVTSGNPKTGYYVSSISVNPAVVDITGVKTVLSNLNYVETVPVDITNNSSDISKDVSLNLPNGIVLQTGSSSKVKINIKFSENDIVRQMDATVSVRNLNGYSVAGINPNQIKVLVSGKSSVINNLKSSDINLSFDFAAKQLSDKVTFDINTPMFKLPDGVLIVQTLPDSVIFSLNKN